MIKRLNIDYNHITVTLTFALWLKTSWRYLVSIRELSRLPLRTT